MSTVTTNGDNTPAGIYRHFLRTNKDECIREILRGWEEIAELRAENNRLQAENERLKAELESATDRCIKAVESEPEYPGEAPKELMLLIEQAVSTKDALLVLHMLRHSVKLTKSEIINRILGKPTQKDPGNTKDAS